MKTEKEKKYIHIKSNTHKTNSYKTFKIGFAPYLDMSNIMGIKLIYRLRLRLGHLHYIKNEDPD